MKDYIMQTEDLISIITPSYNSSCFICDTINSVINQTYQNWEMLIIDDCSKDNSVEMIQKYVDMDSRIKLLQNDENRGAAETRNNGLKVAKGRFIAFLDSDDIWYKDKLKIQYSIMKKNNYPITFTSYDVVDEKGNKKGQIKSVYCISYKEYLKNTIIGMSTSMINKNIVGEFSFYNIKTRQDTYLWMTLLKKGFLAFGINEVLAAYTIRKESISANKFKAAKRVWYLYYNLEKLGFFRSFYYFVNYIFNATKKRI